jgi:hypothetical protein
MRDIQVRGSSHDRFAVVSVGEGFSASDIRRPFARNGVSTPVDQKLPIADVRNPTISSSTVHMHFPNEAIDLTQEDSNDEGQNESHHVTSIPSAVDIDKDSDSNSVTPGTRNRVPSDRKDVKYAPNVNQSSSISWIVISSDDEPSQVNPELAQDQAEPTISPALSYLSLDDNCEPLRALSARTRSLSLAEPSQQQDSQQTSYVDRESDATSTSSDDNQSDGSQVRPQPVHEPIAGPSGMELLIQRLVEGGNADDVLEDASPEQRTRIQAFLTTNPSSGSRSRVANGSDKSRDQGGVSKESEYESDSGDTEPSADSDSQSRYTRTKSRAAAKTTKGSNGTGPPPIVTRRRAVQTPQIVISSSESDSEVDVDQLNGDEMRVVLPKAPAARGRRLLVPRDKHVPIAAVYMRGDVQFIKQSKPNQRWVRISLGTKRSRDIDTS